MKQETNNEIDLLLRRLSRRQGVPASDADLRIDADHLDADELSSYAENVLPAAARARYTEHLAECLRCRELVVQLSGSVSVVAAKETLAAPSGLRKFLASLLSPMVLRYAVPALGLIVAAAIGIVVLNSNRSTSFVAEMDRSKQPVPAAAPNQETSQPMADKQAARQFHSPTATPESVTNSQSKTAPPPPNAAPVVGSVRVEPKTEVEAQKADDQTVANPTPTAAPAAPKAAETTDVMRVEAEGRKPTPQTRGATGNEVAKERSDVGATTEKQKANDFSAASPATAAPSDARAQRGRTLQMTGAPENDADGVIRSVGGRRFRKQSGVWVDTAYDSGSAVVDIARNSEQYRALIADEPTIKTIAEQLAGPVVVVWKRQTYRIR